MFQWKLVISYGDNALKGIEWRPFVEKI